jgi:hypothetical protein
LLADATSRRRVERYAGDSQGCGRLPEIRRITFCRNVAEAGSQASTFFAWVPHPTYDKKLADGWRPGDGKSINTLLSKASFTAATIVSGICLFARREQSQIVEIPIPRKVC